MWHGGAMPYRTAIVALACAFLLAAGARAATPVDPTGTTWQGVAAIKAKASGAGSVADVVDVDLFFGPNAGESVDAGDFLLRADDGQETLEVRGSYAVDAKGQPVLTPDLPDLADELSDLMVHVCEDVLGLPSLICDEIALLDVVVDPAKLKTKVKTSAGSSGDVLQFGTKLPFVLTDGNESVRATVALKGRLAPAP
jgi:hypothetical protein